MPCYGRPMRTRRAIDCILNQNINGWEALITGDGCPYMADLITSSEYVDKIREAESRGNKVYLSNNHTNHGGWGYKIINDNIQKAKGKYFLFMSNDDVITENHFKSYLSDIETYQLDFAYYDTFIKPTGTIRRPVLKNGYIGHSELIIRTEFLKKMPPHEDKYGHDWTLIDNMIKAGGNSAYFHKDPTYFVMGLGELRQDEID